MYRSALKHGMIMLTEGDDTDTVESQSMLLVCSQGILWACLSGVRVIATAGFRRFHESV